MRIFGVILAGGQGRRMGGADKAGLMLGAQTLLANARDRLEPQVEALALSANGDAARFAGCGLPVLADDIAQGPLSGVLAALAWAAPRGADAVVSVAVDTPFFPGDLVPRLWMAADGGLAVALCDGRQHPTFALWPVSLHPALRAYLAAGNARVMGFTQSQGAALAPFPGGTPSPFFNLNTPDDLATAQAAL